MIFLRENGLIEDKITHDHIKRRLLGHWGSASLAFGGLPRLPQMSEWAATAQN
jgi:phosphoketolase